MCHHVLTKMERNTLKYLNHSGFSDEFRSYKRPRYDMSFTHRFSRGLHNVLECINWKVKTKMAFNPRTPSWTPLIGDDAHRRKFPQQLKGSNLTKLTFNCRVFLLFSSKGKVLKWNCELLQIRWRTMIKRHARCVSLPQFSISKSKTANMSLILSLVNIKHKLNCIN